MHYRYLQLNFKHVNITLDQHLSNGKVWIELYNDNCNIDNFFDSSNWTLYPPEQLSVKKLINYILTTDKKFSKKTARMYFISFDGSQITFLESRNRSMTIRITAKNKETKTTVITKTKLVKFYRFLESIVPLRAEMYFESIKRNKLGWTTDTWILDNHYLSEEEKFSLMQLTASSAMLYNESELLEANYQSDSRPTFARISLESVNNIIKICIRTEEKHA